MSGLFHSNLVTLACAFAINVHASAQFFKLDEFGDSSLGLDILVFSSGGIGLLGILYSFLVVYLLYHKKLVKGLI